MLHSIVKLIVILVLSSTSIYAQYGGYGRKLSGTHFDPYHEEFMMSHRKGIANFNDSLSRGIIELPIKIHIVRKSDGSEGVSMQEVKTALKNVNQIFIKNNMRFVALPDYNYIQNDEMYQLNREDEEKFCSKYDIKEVINLYITKSLKSERNNFCGYTYYPSEKPVDRIFIASKYLKKGATLARQIGHYFSLYPTHGPESNMRSEELVSGANCATTGDRICDTPADVGLGRKSVDARCGYLGQMQDAQSKFYRPLTDNIMSDNPNFSCRDKFTREQLSRMLYAAINIRNYLTFPKSEFPKKVLNSMYKENGVTAKVKINITDKNIPIQLLDNLYQSKIGYQSGSKYKIEIENKRKCFIYILGTNNEDISLLYPKKGEKNYFKNELKRISIPSNEDNFEFQVDEGSKYICILFSKKQLNIKEYLEDLNDNSLTTKNLQKRIFMKLGSKLVRTQDIDFGKNSIEINALTNEAYIVPIVVKFKVN